MLRSRPFRHRPLRALTAVALGGLVTAALLAVPTSGPATAGGDGQHALAGSGLTAQQKAVLYGVAKDTWAFYQKDVDPNTHLPLDNLGPGDTRGTYTSAANIGVYLWAVVAAGDLHLISHSTEVALVRSTLTEVASMQRSHGFLLQWYDTATGKAIRNPGDIFCSEETTPTQ